MADPKVAETMREEKIVVTNWRQIMERFEGVRAFVPEGESEVSDDVTESAGVQE